jgi:hypothetical protein
VVGLVREHVGGRVGRLAQKPESGREDGLVELFLRIHPGLADEITGDVLLRKLVIGKVRIEGADEVIPILVRIGNGIVELVPVGLGVTHEIHPVTRPLFPVVR